MRVRQLHDVSTWTQEISGFGPQLFYVQIRKLLQISDLCLDSGLCKKNTDDVQSVRIPVRGHKICVSVGGFRQQKNSRLGDDVR